jgi:hypothetical protein
VTVYRLRGEDFAQSNAVPKWDDSTPYFGSIAYICPTCGEVWGSVVTDWGEWLPLKSGCERHPYLHPVGGSFILPWRRTFEDLPEAVLRREFDLHYEHWIKNATQSTTEG